MRAIEVFRVTLYLTILSLLLLSVNRRAHADLIAYYPFEGDSSDASGNGNDGIDEGDAKAAGPFTGFDGVGQAYEFEAGHVVIPIDINPSVRPDLTVTMWVRPEEFIIDSPGLFKTFGHDDGGWDRTFGLDNREGDYRYAAFTGGAGPGPTATTGTEIDSEWTFLAAVWDTDAVAPGQHTVRFHANENFVEQPLANTPSAHTTAAIGNLRPDNFNEGWQGLIDDVRIFDEALTAEQVESVMQTGEVDPVISVMAILNEDQETHETNGVPNTAAGVATATYTRATGELTWDVQWSGLSGDATGMHFHGPADVGEAAGVQVNIGGAGGLTSPSIGTLDITEAQADEMAAGQWYANIHTAANGAGEIRGQLKPLRPAEWTGGESGLWDGKDWSRVPSENSNVAITPTGSTSVLGPADNALVYSLAVGSNDGVAELRMRSGVTIATLGGLDVTNKGRLVGAGTLTGPLSIQSGGELVVLTGDTFQASGTMRPIAGVVTSMGNLSFEKNVTNLSEGVINATSSTLTFPGNGVKDEIGLTNQGTLNLTRAVVNGDVHSPSGSSINVGVDVIFNGLVSGAANFPGAGLVTFNGGFDPGDSPAKMLFGGDLVFGEENTVRFEIGGLVPGDDYDQVNVLGTVDLNGKLTIELLDDFAPSIGDEFVLMNYGGKSELWFNDVLLPEGQWLVESSDHQLTLVAIPEPSGVLMTLAALPLVTCFRRRRRTTAVCAGQFENPARPSRRTNGWLPFRHLIVVVAASLLTASTVQADLIAYYPFDEDASDQSGNDNDGIEEGNAAPAGPFTGFDGTGGAYSFAGAGHVVVPIDINPDVLEELTVTMWVKPDDSIVNAPGLYKTFGHDDGGWDRTFGLDNREAGDGFRYAAFTGGARPGPTPDTGTPVTSEWTFLAGVWSVDEGTVTFFANENFVEETAIETFSVHVDSAIGNLRPDNFNEGWRGLIDDVRIFDQALTPDEVEQIRMIGQIEDRDFVNPMGGFWDDGSNWTGIGGPNDSTSVTIQPDSGLTVIGPADDATVLSLTIGSSQGVAELRLTGNRTFATTDGLTVGNQGRLIGNGTIDSDVTIEPGGDLTVMTGESLQLSGTASPISGTVNVMGNLTADNSISVAAVGRLNVVGGTLSVPGNNQKDAVGLTNAGQLDLTNAAVNGDVHSPVGSAINVVESAVFNGLVSGAGNFPGAGTVNLNGGFQPGDSAALVEFSGDVNFGESNELLIEIGGLEAGTQYDQLDIAGDVSLAGDLRISLINDFVPAEGNQFTIMNYNSRNDTLFASVSAGWSILYGDQSLVVSFGGGGMLPGDYNLDGVVNVADIDLQAEAMNTANPDLDTYDENGDGAVNFEDRKILIGGHIGTWMGDSNLDRFFNSSDLVAVFTAGFYETGQTVGWAEGDWNGDLVFGSGDLVAAFTDGGYEAGLRNAVAEAVPEPATTSLVLLGMAGLVLLQRRRSQRKETP